MSDSENAAVNVMTTNDNFIEEFLAEVRAVKRFKYFLFLLLGIAMGAMGEEFMDYINHVILHGIYP